MHTLGKFGYAIILALVLGAVPAVMASGPSASEEVAAEDRPNIVLVTADDMMLDELAFMPRTRRLLGRKGVTFEQFIAPNPMCCPSRAQVITGQFAHNNGVHYNEGEWGGYKALKDPDNTLPAWLSDAGYRTGMVGKWLNGWRPRGHQHGQPRGWDRFEVLLRPFHPYRYPVYRDGVTFTQREHSADYVARRTVALIRRFAKTDEPFFIWSSQVPPHKMWNGGEFGPPVPTERHADLFGGEKSPSVQRPSFNEGDISDKPPYVSEYVTPSRRSVNQWFRERIRSLQAVDEGIAAVVRALREAGELDQTYVFFTSDNGYQLGEHRLTLKNFPYEESLRVPLVARGPALPAGTVTDDVRSMIDLAPTFVQLTGATAGRMMDGNSLLSPFSGGSSRSMLLEAGAAHEPWWWRGVRTDRYTYVEYGSGEFVELYDRQSDPFQLENVAGDPEYAEVEAALELEYARLKDCVGPSCS